MAISLADALRQTGYSQDGELAVPASVEPTMTSILQKHIASLPQQLATNQQAMDKTMASMYKTDMATGQPNPNYRPEAMQEFTQIMPGFAGTINKVLPMNRMDIAQLRASLPFKEGGLNLPANNTPMQRARAMGFETAPSKELYHGSRGEIVGNIDPSKSDLGFHIGTLEQAQERLKTFGNRGIDYPEGANIAPMLKSKYADFLNVKDEGGFHAGELFNQLKKNKNLDQNAIKKLEETFLKDERPLNKETIKEYDDVIRELISQQGYKGIKYMNNTEGEGLSYGVIDPSVIRSKFAAFDPYMEKSTNPMAAGLAVPMVSPEEKKSRKQLLEEQLNKKRVE